MHKHPDPKGSPLPSSDLIFIVGRQRTGTTVFRDLLARHGAVNCDEIFHGDLSRPHRFFGHVLKEMEANPQVIHPHHHARLFHEYIEVERSAAGGRKLAMDVKYFGLNLIPQHEDVDNSMPFVVNFMRHSKAHVVHVIRRNKLRVYVSEEMSRETGRWSAEKAEHVLIEKPKLKIDVKLALQFIDRLTRQDDRVSTMLAAIPFVARLHYDEMFTADGLFSDAAQDVAARVMDLDGVDPKPGNLKMNPEGLGDLVENYEELAAAIQNTPHEWMLTGKD